MLFESTTLLLRSIIQSLETREEAPWDDHVEAGKQCVYELFQMSRPSNGTYRTETNPRFHTVVPASERAVRAIPHVKSMNVAIRNEDREAAIEHGRLAIAEMTGTAVIAPRVPAGHDTVVGSEQPPAPSNRGRKAEADGVPGRKRKNARVLTAGSR
jgi:hypothetical protein